MKRLRTRVLALVGACAFLPLSAFAQESRPSDARAREVAPVDAEGSWFAPLFSDTHAVVRNSDQIDTSSIQFGRTFTAGFSYSYLDGVDDPLSGGIFINPRLAGESQLVLGVSIVDTFGDTAFEVQGKYTLASGLGLASGYHRTGSSGQDDALFLRVDYDLEFLGMNLNVAPLAQRNPDGDEDVDLGGYIRLSGPSMNFGYGYDGEEVRGVANYVAPQVGPLRPAAELLYINSEVGDIDAGEFYLFTATTSFSGGFLSPLYSIGRGAGPSAVYFPNPVSFTSATYNRLYDVWELGSQFNVRIQGFKQGSVRVTDYQVSLHPAHFFEGDQGRLERLFLGFKHTRNEGLAIEDVDSPFVGYFGQLVGSLNAALVFGYDFQDDQSEVTLGLVYVH